MPESDIHLHIHIHRDDERIEQIMSEQTQLRAQQEHTLQRLARLEAKSDAEHEQVTGAIQAFRTEIDNLKNQNPGEPYDPSVIDAAFDRLEGKVEAIYTPDPAPVEPEPTPEPPVDPAPAE